MTDQDPKGGDEQPAAAKGAAAPAEDQSIDAASQEAVEFMESGDEPGNAGRGDVG